MALRTYDAYGASAGASPRGARSMYAGEPVERDLGWYLLGDRPYSPVLRRFLAPDPASPFADGGFNRYTYCSGDPVNRIDPTGESWMNWLVAGIALTFAVVATAASAGALAGTVVAAGSLAAAAATPGIVATTAAVVADVVALTATIGSTATMATGNEKMNGIFGWVNMGAGVTSSVAMVTAVKQGATFGKGVADVAGTQKALPSTTPRPGTSAANTGNGSAAASSRPRIAATLDNVLRAARVATEMVRQSNATPAGKRTVIVPSANVDRSAARGMVQRASNDGARAVSIIAGTPRSSRPASSVRRENRRAPFRGDLRDAVRTGASAGTQVSVEQVDRLTPEQTRERLTQVGLHVSSSGSGMVDEVMLKALNFSEALRGGLQWTRASI